LGKNVKVLAQLQEIDLKIDSARGEKQSFQEGISALETKVEEMRQDIACQAAELEAVEGEKRALEENIAAETDAIASSGRIKGDSRGKKGEKRSRRADTPDNHAE